MNTGARALRDGGMPGVTRGLAATMPIVLVGSMALTTLGIAPLPLSHREKDTTSRPNRSRPTELHPVMRMASDLKQDAAGETTVAPASAVPATVIVQPGDSVSEIATRFGLSTASVLALNGLSWKSLIFPGQVLRLTSAKPAVVTAAAAVHAPAPANYTIARGDTLTSIATRFGTSVPALLSANHLVASSIIYAGRTLVIPGASTANADATLPLSPAMAANARVIISVGRSLGVPSYGIVIALATAAQESALENLDYGDRDSVGLFQQRPSSGWGTVAQLTDPTYASELFYGGPSNPNKGRTRGLLDVPGWQEMTLTTAAQAVQISGAPTAYAKWETSARSWLAQLG